MREPSVSKWAHSLPAGKRFAIPLLCASPPLSKYLKRTRVGWQIVITEGVRYALVKLLRLVTITGNALAEVAMTPYAKVPSWLPPVPQSLGQVPGCIGSVLMAAVKRRDLAVIALRYDIRGSCADLLKHTRKKFRTHELGNLRSSIV